MKIIIIRRYYPTATNGNLYVSGYHSDEPLCHTIELPWKNNHPKISCIPEGEYRLRIRYSHKFKKHIEVMDVRDRSLILIHPANNAMEELKGCIAPVTQFTGHGMGSLSRLAFNSLMFYVSLVPKGESNFLIIKSIRDDNTK